MPSQETHFRYLFDRFVSKQASKEELNEFFELLKEPGNNEFSLELLDAYFSSPSPKMELDRTYWLNKLQTIKGADARSVDPAETPVYEIKPGRKQLTWVAAAAILLLLSAGSYLLVSRRSTREFAAKNNTIIAPNNDKAPGGNKATLYLANGQKINLDTAHNGQLAKLGSTSVTKTDSGKLLYATAENNISESVGLNTLQTPRGGQYQLILPDGTKVWLNAASSITYPTVFIDKERKVTVTGEAYFEVAHNQHYPFRVKVNDQIIEDIGTSFNVNGYMDEFTTKTTLIEGAIKVSSKTDDIFKILRPGQQAMTSSEKKIEISEIGDLDNVIAWKNGEMVIAKGSIQKLMQDISRWYDVDVEYKSTVPAGQFSGSIDRNVPLSAVLKILNAYGIRTQIENKKLIVE